MEGWIALLDDGSVFIIKGCEHPLPCFFAVPKRLGLLRVKNPWSPTHLDAWSTCLGLRYPVICPGYASFTDPVEYLERLVASGFSDEILEALLSTTGGRVGVTGSLVYEPWRARDIDIVVYGMRESTRALGVLLELWSKGALEPVGVEEYTSTWREMSLDDWAAATRFNPLVFRYKGRVYSVKLVSCTEPTPCKPLERVEIRVRVTIKSGIGAPCVIPRWYVGLASGIGEVLVYTLRSSLSCLPRGTVLEGVMTLEENGSFKRLVPDGGCVRIQLLQV